MSRTRLTKIAKIVGELERIADEIQPENERIALHLDHITDMVEKVAFSPQAWMPGRGLGRGRGHGFGMGWMPGSRVKMQMPGKKPDAGGLMICPGCGCRAAIRETPSPKMCPKCGSEMNRVY